MATVVSYDDVIDKRTQRIREDGKWTGRVDFLVSPPDAADLPQAFISEQSPGRFLQTHFHDTDQFQIFIHGGGTNGHHPISPYQIHFARKHTPYGPLIASEQDGCWFFTLRAKRDPGAQYLPENREKLDSVVARKPWQVSVDVSFPAGPDAVSIAPIEQISDDRGLAAQVISLAPNASTSGPKSQGSEGQYIVMLEGSMIHEGRERTSKTVVYVAPGDEPFSLVAGAKGMQAVALNFPRTEIPTQAALAQADASVNADLNADYSGGEFKVWACVLCAFIYDEAEGLPLEGIPPGTRWADVPDEWGCPDCSAKKADFDMVEL